jgi:hypothetical protein
LAWGATVVEAESESVVPETASCEMASAKRVKAPPLALLQGRGGVAFCHLDDLTGYLYHLRGRYRSQYDVSV